MENPNYPYIRQRLKGLGMSQGDIARALGVSRQAVNYGLRIGTLRGVQQYVADLLGEPAERLFPPAQKRGPKPKSYWAGAVSSTKTQPRRA